MATRTTATQEDSTCRKWMKRISKRMRVCGESQLNINSNSMTTMPAITTTTTTRTRQETQEETKEGEEQAHLSVQFNQPSKEGKKGRKSECKKSNNKILTPAQVSFVSSFFCSTRKVRKSFLALALAFYLAPFSFPLPSPLSPSPPTTTITLYYRLL